MSYSNNDQPITQQEFTYLACNPYNNIIVQACAGSGKTWLLASRILRILIEGGNPENILAITFTKKAAYEMKYRVMQWLEYFSTFRCSEHELIQELQLRNIQITTDNLLRARNLYFNLLSSPQNLQISTFHVWFLSLINSAPLEYINYNSNIRADENILYDECLTAFMYSEIYKKYQNLFNDFMECWQVNSILDNKFIKALWEKRGNLTVHNLMNFENFASPNDKLLQELQQICIPSFSLSKMHINIIEDIFKLIKNDKGITAQKIYNNICLAGQNNHLKQVVQSLTTAEMKTIRKIGIKNLQHEFENLANILIEDYFTLHNNAFLSIGKIFFQAYYYFKQQQNVIEFTDIEKNAYIISNQEEIAQYIWCRLDNKYKHILIDEFQDTNLLQWNIIKNWLNAYGNLEIVKKPSIFIVGDNKQAIYSFRGSDSIIFNHASEYLQQYYQAYNLATYHTRRCSSKVIEWVNLALCDNQNTQYKPHTTDNIGGQGLLLEQAPDIQIHNQQIITYIKYLNRQNNVKFKDILILSSTRKLWNQLQLDLQNANIPVFAQQQGGLLQTPEIYIILNLIRFVLDTDNNYALSNILTSPTFNIKLSSILDTIGINNKISYWQQINNISNLSAINGNLYNSIQILKNLINCCHNYTPLDFIQYLYINLDIAYKFSLSNPSIQVQIHANLQHFLNIILEYNGGRYPNLADLLEFLLNYQYTKHFKESPACANYNTQNAVTLNTIHGAKGLEYPIIILIDTYSYKNYDSTIIINKDNNKILFGNKNIHNLLLSRKSIINFIQTQHHQEYKNLLYVAMTRAKQIFVASSILPSKKINNNDIWYNTLKNTCQNQITTEDKTEENTIFDSNETGEIPVQYIKKIHIIPSNIQIQPRENASIGQQIGKLMHDILERICRCIDQNIPFNFPNLEQAMIWLNLAPHKKFMLETALKNVQNILHSIKVQHIFNPKYYIQAFCEISFNYKNKIYRIDRLIKNLNNEIIIVDYKLGDEQKHINEYKNQIELYKFIVSKNYNVDINKIKGGIINSIGEWINI